MYLRWWMSTILDILSCANNQSDFVVRCHQCIRWLIPNFTHN